MRRITNLDYKALDILLPSQSQFKFNTKIGFVKIKNRLFIGFFSKFFANDSYMNIIIIFLLFGRDLTGAVKVLYPPIVFVFTIPGIV